MGNANIINGLLVAINPLVLAHDDVPVLLRSIIARSATSVRALLKSIAFICLVLFGVVRSPKSAFRPRKYRLAPQIWDLGVLE